MVALIFLAHKSNAFIYQNYLPRKCNFLPVKIGGGNAENIFYLKPSSSTYVHFGLMSIYSATLLKKAVHGKAIILQPPNQL